MTKVVAMVDPPAGWKYGFPKVFDFKPSHPNLPGEEYEREFREWFSNNGYPDNLIRDGMHKHSRYWEAKAPEDG